MPSPTRESTPGQWPSVRPPEMGGLRDLPVSLPAALAAPCGPGFCCCAGDSGVRRSPRAALPVRSAHARPPGSHRTTSAWRSLGRTPADGLGDLQRI
ncbi:hypothetical protein AAFF_G00125570 [Aldrovandia affinis]|uniref:Uncharacterized protein n=1 Tax=Aldrovandia affinis TaxID=143900 RepID=A0AAD7RRD6_9TELE|nr:hypothetical protein AAFF_G00125570 [Aldrovandia affinis]